MSILKRKIESLVKSTHEEDYSKAQSLLIEIVEGNVAEIQIEDFSELLEAAAVAVDSNVTSSLYDRITDWALAKYTHEKSSRSPASSEYADTICSWLNHKIEIIEDPAGTKESHILLDLFSDMVEHSSSKRSAVQISNDYQGLASYSLIIGLAEQNVELINQAISAQRKVLDLYQHNDFPSYYNLSSFIAGSKRELASVLMEAYEYDSELYAAHRTEIVKLLKEAAGEFEKCGTDFDKEYTASLLVKAENL